jgi:hypothetical protein
MPVLPILSGRGPHGFAAAPLIPFILFPHSRNGSAPGVPWRLSHLLSCSAGLWKRQGKVSLGPIGPRVKTGKGQAPSGC